MNSNQQYFFFKVHGNLYCLPALEVDQIIEYQTITKVPLMNKNILGVINVRGTLMSVVGLAQRFGMDPQTITDRTSIVIFNTIFEEQNHKVALLIDEIFEVDTIQTENIIDIPSFGNPIENKYIKNLFKYNNNEVISLNTEILLQLEALSSLYYDPTLEDSSLYTKKNIRKETLTSYDDEDDDDLYDILRIINSNSNETNQYLIFSGPQMQLYAKNVSKIEEIISLKEIIIQSNFDENMIVGMADIRGEIIPLINFDKWLGDKSWEKSHFEEVIVLNFGNYKFGLVVQATYFISTIPTQDMKESSHTDTKSTFIAKIEFEESLKLCTIVDSDKMIIDIFQSQSEKNESDLDHIIPTAQSDKLVLFADDSSLIRNTLKKSGEKLGIKYKIFENGLELWSFLEENKIYDIPLIITDLEMPVMNGQELIAKIRKKDKYDDMKIHVYSNMANKALKEQLIKSGVTEIITKIDIENLAHKIKECL